MTDFREFYRTQSFITDPKHLSVLYDALPDDIPTLCRVVQGLVYHYFADEQFWGFKPPHDRMPEIDTRYVDRILARLLEMDSRPLPDSRPPEKRIIGCCRDFSTLFTSMCRHKGIPARTRSGFGAYMVKGYYIDHVVVEVWEEDRQRWRMVDPEMPVEAPFDFDVQDMPPGKFVLAGSAWQMCREKLADPERFGLGPDGPQDVKGWTFIQTRLLQDVAALNKTEMLCWDNWGSLSDTLNVDDVAFVDKVAALTLAGNDALPELWALYAADSRLTVPEVVQCFSPALPFEQLPIPVTIALPDTSRA